MAEALHPGAEPEARAERVDLPWPPADEFLDVDGIREFEVGEDGFARGRVKGAESGAEAWRAMEGDFMGSVRAFMPWGDGRSNIAHAAGDAVAPKGVHAEVAEGGSASAEQGGDQRATNSCDFGASLMQAAHQAHSTRRPASQTDPARDTLWAVHHSSGLETQYREVGTWPQSGGGAVVAEQYKMGFMRGQSTAPPMLSSSGAACVGDDMAYAIGDRTPSGGFVVEWEHCDIEASSPPTWQHRSASGAGSSQLGPGWTRPDLEDMPIEWEQDGTDDDLAPIAQQSRGTRSATGAAHATEASPHGGGVAVEWEEARTDEFREVGGARAARTYPHGGQVASEWELLSASQSASRTEHGTVFATGMGAASMGDRLDFAWQRRSKAAAPSAASSEDGGGAGQGSGRRAAAAPLLRPSPGCRGHPALCARPCLFHASGTCANGEACNFCHLPHPAPPATMDKRQRERLMALPREAALGLAFPVLAQKVYQVSAAPHIKGAYFRLCEASGASTSRVDMRRLSSVERALSNTFASMNCRRFLVMLKRTLLRENPRAVAAADQLEEAMLQCAQ